jgi:sortase (surface protein transpeptidase)
MVNGDIMKSLGELGLLVLIGLILICVYSAVRTRSMTHSRESSREQTSTTASGPENPSSRKAGIPDFRLWSEERIEAYQRSLLGDVLPPLGVLKIPSIELEVPSLEGSDDLTLNRSVVPPENVSVLAARSKPALTLVTCYPFYLVGSAPLRYVVYASITGSSNL